MSNNNTNPRTSILLDKSIDVVLQHNFDAVSTTCLITILKLLDNVLQKPYEIKFRTVKLSNNIVQQKIVQCKGGVDILIACGFLPVPENPSILQIPIDSTPNNNTNTTNTNPVSSHLPTTPQEHEQQFLQNLITSRHTIARRCILELGCQPEELPHFQAPPPSLIQQIDHNNNNATNPIVSSLSSFNPYQGQRFDILSASVGTNLLGPSNNTNNYSKSKTEMELERLLQQQQQLEKELYHKNGNNNDNTTTNPIHATNNSHEWVAFRSNETIQYISSNNKNTVVTEKKMNLSSTTRRRGGGVNGNDDSSDDTGGDASLLASRAQKLLLERTQRDQQGFTTLAMRQLEQLKHQKVYNYATLQIYFPDGIRLCGKFLPKGTLYEVYNAIQRECLQKNDNNKNNKNQQNEQQQQKDKKIDGLEFYFYMTPPRRQLSMEKTLLEEGLVPAAKLYVSWNASIQSRQIQSNLFHNNSTKDSTTTTMHGIAYPTSHAIIRANNNIPDTTNNATNNNSSQPSKPPTKKKLNREEELLKRMMGGGN